MFSETLQHLRTLGVVSIDFYLLLISMVEKDISMAEKGQTFNSFVSGNIMITLDKLIGSENYQSWADSVDLWFIGNGCEDHLTTADTSIPEDKRTQWKKTNALAIFFDNLLMLRLYIILRPLKLAPLFGIR